MALNVTDSDGNLVLTNSLFDGLGISDLLPGDENSAKRSEVRSNLNIMANIIIQHIQDNGQVISVSCSGVLAPGTVNVVGTDAAQSNTVPINVSVSGTGSIL